MGLEIAELALDFEESFNIRVTDAEAQQCETVRAWIDLVCSKTRQKTTEACPSQRGFYRIRRHLVESLGCHRAEVKPETRLKELIDRDDRKPACTSIRRELVSDFDLRRPRWLSFLVFLVLPSLIIFYDHGLVHGWWKILLAIGVMIMGSLLTRPLKRYFPWRFCKVKHLVPYVGTLDSRVWTRQDIASKVQEEIAQITSLDKEDVREDHHLVTDLGIG